MKLVSACTPAYLRHCHCYQRTDSPSVRVEWNHCIARALSVQFGYEKKDLKIEGLCFKKIILSLTLGLAWGIIFQKIPIIGYTS